MAGSQYTDLLSSMPTPSITPFTPLRGANVAGTLHEPNECRRETADPQLHNGWVLNWPLEYGLCVATARLSLHGGLDWVTSFGGHPTETPG
ncbi:hypothetical protein EYF80_018969 [Liparis tanakae]|uniref:Uncharacterized protein n=1 Tax=Liparis tanakae TaxID=230148 RepID=A0A4Z2HZR7_9TELE|nr:hypothetical protein EYF80_018969 [Liparis tanakae]